MSRSTEVAPRVIPYALEQLFVDQPLDWVIDAIAPVLAWVPGVSPGKRRQPFRFEVEHVEGAAVATVRIDLRWDDAALERAVPGVVDHARRLHEGRSVQREHLAELAAYGLTFVAISTLMPGRRVAHMQMGMAPDILFDLTPGALRGVETAGRTSGGRAALAAVRDGTGIPARSGKRSQLLARADLAEVHLSLWCAAPRVSIMERLKP
jgi:hypothetical protein